jgi:TonB family protein
MAPLSVLCRETMKTLSTLLVLPALLFVADAPARTTPADDVGIGIDQTVPVTYPATMQTRGIPTGEARVVISVDAEGRLTDCLVVGYTHEAFANEVVSAVKRWVYEPARVGGHARAASTNLIFKFSSDYSVIVEGLGAGVETHFIPELRNRYSYAAYQLRHLDRIPTPVHVVQPSLSDLPEKPRTVIVEFYIDEEGRVRAPSVSLAEAENIYAAAAVAAVEQWRFEPPLRRGKPVLVVAKQEFRFLAKK